MSFQVFLAASAVVLAGCAPNSASPEPTDAGPTDAVVADVADARDAPPPRPATPPLPSRGNPLRWVRPLIGSQGSGNVFVGTSLPHGAIKLGPDTRNEADSLDGYAYEATAIEGFSHTHLDGPGGSSYGYSQMLLLPQTGPLIVDPAITPAPFSHDDETATPAYYAVDLPDRQVHAEVTTTAHCGLHRYTFSSDDEARILLDLGHTRGASTGGQVQISPTGVRGRGDYIFHPLLASMMPNTKPPTGQISVYLTATFSEAFRSVGTARKGKSLQRINLVDGKMPVALTGSGAELLAWVEFAPPVNETTIDVCVCLSWLSQDNADGFAESAECTQGFDKARKTAEGAWEKLLDRVRLDGITDVDRTRFYTALYHALLQPADYTENDQFWNGMANPPAAEPAKGRRHYTDDWCAWDTARTTHPLLTLMNPEVVEDMAQSLVALGRGNGFLPKCPWQASGDSRIMTANFQYAILADAIVKGFTRFDTEDALNLMVKGAMHDALPLGENGLCGYFDQGTPPFYVKEGFVPSECDGAQAASMTLEYAYHDWCLAQAAQALGDTKTEAKFRKRIGNWKNVWNPEHGYPQLRHENGDWLEPFDPGKSLGFTEANAYIYQWFVPHQVCELARQMGGNAAMAKRLDAFFVDQFDMSNEPDFHVPWLYQDLGMPEKTQEVLDALLAKHFSDGPDGLPGNDDAGAMSAWFVLAAMGFYPVAPGDGIWRVTAPLPEKVSIDVGKTAIRVEVTRRTPASRFIQSATWNDQPLSAPMLEHGDLVQGGILQLDLGPTPGKWARTACPP